MKITKRQLEVLQLYANGYVEKQVAEKLHISSSTVKSHLTKIREWNNFDTTMQTIAEAFREGLLK